MDLGVYKIKDISNEEIRVKVKNKESFILDCEDSGTLFVRTHETLEKMIETEGMKVRVYTIGRVAAMGAAAWTGWGTLIAAGAGAAIAAHNIATWSPDYEIGKSPLNKKIYVQYKK
ncbi:hypothetical protein [Pseudomonas moorei]|uniref:hypothetical protein n=1 Tax=Pseudomonas moorei TaxID=395599 RepID=UPI0036F31207